MLYRKFIIKYIPFPSSEVSQIILSAMASTSRTHPITLPKLLQNRLIFHQISPYVDIVGLLSLAATSKILRHLVYETPQVFQYLDLSSKTQQLGSSNLASAEDDCFSSPLDAALSAMKKHSVLQNVRTLILDGLDVPSNYLLDLLCSRVYQIRVLSLCGVGMLSDDKLQRILRYIIRPSRPFPKDAPKLRAVYWFGENLGSLKLHNDAIDMPSEIWNEGATMRSGARLGVGLQARGSVTAVHDPYAHSVYAYKGAYRRRPEPRLPDEWANLLNACRGIITFDMVLCSHDPVHLSVPDPAPKLATVRLSGCEVCGSCPESPAYPGISVCYHVSNMCMGTFF